MIIIIRIITIIITIIIIHSKNEYGFFSHQKMGIQLNNW
jgi:hypothetical protein